MAYKITLNPNELTIESDGDDFKIPRDSLQTITQLAQNVIKGGKTQPVNQVSAPSKPSGVVQHQGEYIIKS